MSVAGPGAELLTVDLGTQSLRLAAYDDAGRRRWAWSANPAAASRRSGASLRASMRPTAVMSCSTASR
jgi:hypothetical protein